MVNYKKKDVKIKPFYLISFLLCVVAVFLGAVVGSSSSNYQIEQSVDTYISSLSDLTRLSEAIYNDTVYLKTDITITDPDFMIGSQEHPFEGVFDGKGHTIYLSYSNANNDTSLFSYIAPGAVIRNVTFVLRNVDVTGESYGAIAKINDGTIENCKVIFDKININNEGLFSPFVVVNRGSIDSVVVHGTVNKAKDTAVEDKVLYGNVCVYNKGSISNVLVNAKYTGFTCTDEKGYIEGTSHNTSISAVRYNDLAEGVTNNVLAIIPDGEITSDMFTVSSDVIEFLEEATNVYHHTWIFTRLGFDNTVWEITDDDVILKGEGR